MNHYQYLILMGLCLVLTLPLEFVFSARVWRRPRRLARALWPVIVIFGGWDIWAVAADHWSFSRRLTTGVDLPGGLPVEELVFFLVVPVCGILTFEAVRNMTERRGR